MFNDTTKTLYQKDSNGKLRMWSICVIHSQNPNYSEIIVHSGIYNGKLIRVVTPIEQGSNIGRANEKSVREQAEFDAQTEINKKVKQGYVEDINEAKSKEESATIKKPMKAETYHPTGKNKAFTLDKLGIRGNTVGLQRKYDGWRFRLAVSRLGVIFYTSSGDEAIPFPQIEKSIMSRYEKFVDLYGTEEFILDGEIYNHKLGFQATASACGTTVNFTKEKMELRNQMQFHLFDFVDITEPYPNREEMISTFYDLEYIIPVETTYVKCEESVIDELFIKYLGEGYEGLMLRTLGSGYEHKRTRNLIKYKPLCDDEFEVIGFKKSITGETLGSLILRMSTGAEFDANLKGDIGSDAFKQEVWNNKSKYLGKIATVEYLEYTDDGVPRHPRAKSFRDKTDIS